VLVASFGTLVCVAVLSVLGISLYSGLTNTQELLREKATSEMTAVKRNLTELLDPLENQARYLAKLIYSEQIDLNDSDSLDRALIASLAGSHKKAGIIFIFPDLSVRIANPQLSYVIHDVSAEEPDGGSDLMSQVSRNIGYWAPLLYAPDAGETVMSFRQPIIKNGEFLGLIIAAIPVSVVRDAVRADGMGQNDGRFILYGKDHVLTYEGFQVLSDKLTYEGVTPKLSEIPDPVLSSIWTAPRTPFRLVKATEEFNGHFTDLDGERYQFVYTELGGYTDKPLILGYKTRFEDAIQALRRLAYAGTVGIAILLISIIIAFFIGRKISRPILALSRASQEISKLDFAKAKNLPRSRLKELDEANNAYNTMLRGLGWFENYVPKSLVRKLMNTGEAHSENRGVTVMFTDIVGFTPLAEKMPAEDTAKLLNEHFEMVTSCIEVTGGTVDKFIGDAVMAFWGAPEYQNDHAVRACQAALAIQKIIQTDNQKRIQRSESPVHMRIGIHTGRLMVGNIGSSGRLNYTVVGDTVNVAQRIEQLGKSIPGGQDNQVFTLISDAVHREISENMSCQQVGVHNVKGRNEEIEIYHLL
jgi:adenylate cyclase